MDFSKLTVKAQEAISGASERARTSGNPELTTLHLLQSLVGEAGAGDLARGDQPRGGFQIGGEIAVIAQRRHVLPQARDKSFEVQHLTLYRVHQRVAKTFQSGRAFLAGDAAHINNPLGGMGMNGGIHDVVDLADRIVRVHRGVEGPRHLEGYDTQRRGITLEYVQKHTVQNKRNLEARDEATRTAFRDELLRISADPALTRGYLERLSMIASLKRAREIR